MGSPLTGTLSKLTREAFYELYGNIQATESQQEQNYQHQQYIQAYYKNFFEHLANSGYYYDAASNEYRKLEDRNSFEKVDIGAAHPIEKKDTQAMIEVDYAAPFEAGLGDQGDQENNAKNLSEEKLAEQILHKSEDLGQNQVKDHIATEMADKRTESLQASSIFDKQPPQTNQQKVHCLLCRRQFHSEPHLSFHKRYSAKHKKAVLDRLEVTCTN